MIRKLFFPIVILLVLASCNQPKDKKPDFTFAFLTDIHVEPQNRAEDGLRAAIEKVNDLNVDFVITGGDLIMDALGQTRGRADSLYQLYKEISKDFKMPVYNTPGNHELFAFFNHEIETDDPDYNHGMYQRYLGDPWQSFDFNGWHFINLKSIEDTETRGYHGEVCPEQVDWLKKDLASVNDTTPVVVTVHIPLISAWNQWTNGGLSANGPGNVINNGKEVLDLLKKKNLKLVLQGHLHLLEDYYAGGTHFITGGAVSGSWWRGPNNGSEEGFVLVKVYDGEFEWEYIDYGWEVKN